MGYKKMYVRGKKEPVFIYKIDFSGLKIILEIPYLIDNSFRAVKSILSAKYSITAKNTPIRTSSGSYNYRNRLSFYYLPIISIFSDR